ncbi:MAG: 16S rRNA (cytidine(1402)-2'-O)-methyltransferase [Flavobacterium piscis]|nr:16S rRNA (cytidine(1402)-2'-O)-methyltransferase [Flavobacterium piscis]
MAKLYIVPTPIGNLEDMTFRAVRILKEVDYILAEDTRTSSILLKHYNIEAKLYSHHKFNEHKAVKHIAERIASGESFALISDAGTPSISDPGYLLVSTCIKIGVEVECLPGATAFVPALVNSGFPSERFCFEGFLPQKKGRNKRLEKLKDEERTIIFYESPFRLLKTLKDLYNIYKNGRNACVCRELTKIHEENIRGNLESLIAYFESRNVKGEIVIIIEAKTKNKEIENEL